jgi:glutaredoxin
MVKVFTRTTCGPCRTVKYWLQKNKVSYEEVDISNSNHISAPTIEIGSGEEKLVIVGPNLKLLTELLL